MSKKRKSSPRGSEIEKQTDYYRLNTRAVDDLVGASEENAPEVSEEELRTYRSGPRLKAADWVKALFVKFWFAAAVCYFFIWGLGVFLASELDLLFVTGMALGIVTNMLTGPVLRFMEKTPGENARWMMVARKSFSGFFLDILYGYLVLFLIYTLYNAINLVIIRITGAAGDTVPLGVEPVLFGLFYLGIDLVLLWVKHTAGRALHGASRKRR